MNFNYSKGEYARLEHFASNSKKHQIKKMPFSGVKIMPKRYETESPSCFGNRRVLSSNGQEYNS